jgi:hypothetical protein
LEGSHPTHRLGSAAARDHTVALRRGSTSTLHVSGKYEIQDDWIRPVIGPASDTGPTWLYYPILYPSLPFELAKLKDADDQHLVDFVSRWGLPGLRGLMNPDHLQFAEMNAVLLGSSRCQMTADYSKAMSEAGLDQEGDPVQWIRDHARSIDLILDAVEAIRNPADRNRPVALRNLGTSRNGSCWVNLAIRDRCFDMPWPIDDVNAIDLSLAASLNINVAGVQKIIYGGTITQVDRSPGFTFHSLIEFAYWHLIESISDADQHSIIRCEDPTCGAWFARTDPRQRYCPKAPGRKKSACLNRVGARKHRKK